MSSVTQESGGGKFTPGPWTATGWEQVIVNDGNGNTIVCMPGANYGLDTTKANARLIAAAPDLYSALVRIEAAFQSIYGDADSHMLGAAGGEGDPKLIRSYIRAALAKAVPQ